MPRSPETNCGVPLGALLAVLAALIAATAAHALPVGLDLPFAAARQWSTDDPNLAPFNQGFAPPKLVYSGEALAGQQFTDRDLAGTRWQGADLRGARFTGCTLDGADFSEAYLGGAAFQRCSLGSAQFREASLRGAYMGGCDLSGADFAGADIAGMTLVDLTLSPTHALHLPAIRAAIELRGGPPYSPALIAAASGDAFAFTYDRNDPAAWPGRPMTFAPIPLALQTLGFDASYKINLKGESAARKELAGVLRRGLVAVLPMRLAGAGLDGNAVEGPVWVVAHEMTTDEEGDVQIQVLTPFGPMAFAADDLLRRWRGPWPALTPAGESLNEARFPLCSVGAQRAEVTDLAAVVSALRNASAIMNESRVFGEAHGGFEAYEALIADIGNEDVVVGDLVHWSGNPREVLVASRRLAAEYLTEASSALPEAARAPASEAATLYEEVAVLLSDEWPIPAPSAFKGEAAATAVGSAATRRPHAAAALQEALARERRAMALLEQAIAEAVRAPG